MFNKLYENIGEKIKSLAKLIFIFEAIASIIVGFVYLKITRWALLIIVFGPIVALLSTWILYAFGDLVEKTSKNENNTKQILIELSTKPIKKQHIVTGAKIPKDTTKHTWRCDECGKLRSQTPCEYCGEE